MASDSRSYRKAAAWLLALSIPPLIVTIIMWLPDRDLANGPRVDAEVIEVLSVRQSSKGPPETSSLRITFSTNAGERITTTVRTTRRQFGETFSVTYNPGDPSEVRAVDGAEVPWRIPAIITATAAGFACWLLWTVMRLRLGSPSRLYRRIVWENP